MAPKYKLFYFDIKALAEPIRMLFSYANVEFEDVRVAREDWPKLKPQMPFNVMPVLEEDGKQLSQSLAIFRYLGRKFGLAGADEFQTAKCNEYIDAMVDVRLEVTKVFKESDEGKKVELKKTAKEVTLPKNWKKFNEILKTNGTGVLVGSAVTYADIYIAFMVEWISGFFELTDMEDYPEVMAHRQKILGSPGIEEWIKKRPVTPF